MASYEYKCGACGHSWGEVLSIDNRDIPLQYDCPSCGVNGEVTRPMTTGTLVTGVNLAAKVPHGFRDVLKKVKSAHPRHKIDGELS